MCGSGLGFRYWFVCNEQRNKNHLVFALVPNHDLLISIHYCFFDDTRSDEIFFIDYMFNHLLSLISDLSVYSFVCIIFFPSWGFLLFFISMVLNKLWILFCIYCPLVEVLKDYCYLISDFRFFFSLHTECHLKQIKLCLTASMYSLEYCRLSFKKSKMRTLSRKWMC